jgi:antitoxin component YwqK of YwqJK toxin-antitoxin module
LLLRKRDQTINTLELLDLTLRQKTKGVWLSGVKKEGEYKRWHSNGKLQSHCHYKNGKLEGECKTWYDNGQLWIQCFYKNDRLHGEYKTWLKNGKLVKHCFYYNNKLHTHYSYKTELKYEINRSS